MRIDEKYLQLTQDNIKKEKDLKDKYNKTAIEIINLLKKLDYDSVYVKCDVSKNKIRELAPIISEIGIFIAVINCYNGKNNGICDKLIKWLCRDPEIIHSYTNEEYNNRNNAIDLLHKYGIFVSFDRVSSKRKDKDNIDISFIFTKTGLDNINDVREIYSLSSLVEDEEVKEKLGYPYPFN